MNFKRNILVAVGLGLVLLSALPLNASDPVVLDPEVLVAFGIKDDVPELSTQEGILVALTFPREFDVYDICYPYTSSRVTHFGSVAAVEARNYEHVRLQNEAFYSNGILGRVRLAWQGLHPYVETGDMMDALTSVIQGAFSNVGPFAGMREKYGCDAIMLGVSFGGGLATLGVPLSVVGTVSITSAAHESGHMHGADHDIDHATVSCDPADVMCHLARGRCWMGPDGQWYGDLMCVGIEVGRRQNFYSDPFKLHNGVPTGVLDESQGALVVANNMKWMANQRSPKRSSKCIAQAGSICLRNRFELLAYWWRPTNHGWTTSVTVSADKTSAAFKYGTLPVLTVRIDYVGSTAVVKTTGTIPGPVQMSLLVLDHKSGLYKSYGKLPKKPWQNIADSATFEKSPKLPK